MFLVYQKNQPDVEDKHTLVFVDDRFSQKCSNYERHTFSFRQNEVCRCSNGRKFKDLKNIGNLVEVKEGVFYLKTQYIFDMNEIRVILEEKLWNDFETCPRNFSMNLFYPYVSGVRPQTNSKKISTHAKNILEESTLEIIFNTECPSEIRRYKRSHGSSSYGDTRAVVILSENRRITLEKIGDTKYFIFQ